MLSWLVLVVLAAAEGPAPTAAGGEVAQHRDLEVLQPEVALPPMVGRARLRAMVIVIVVVGLVHAMVVGEAEQAVQGRQGTQGAVGLEDLVTFLQLQGLLWHMVVAVVVELMQNMVAVQQVIVRGQVLHWVVRVVGDLVVFQVEAAVLVPMDSVEGVEAVQQGVVLTVGMVAEAAMAS